MSIRYEHTPTALWGRLGFAAGKAQAAREEQQIRQRQIEKVQDMQFQRDMMNFREQLDKQAAQRAMAWELQKAEINSQFELQESLKMESILKDRDLRKRIEQEDNLERALKEWTAQYGDPNTASEDVKEIFDNWYQQLIAQTYGFKSSVQRQTQPSFAKQWQEYEALENLKAVGAVPTAMPEMPTAEAPTTALAEPKSIDEYNRIPTGASYRAPDGSIRIKQ